MQSKYSNQGFDIKAITDLCHLVFNIQSLLIVDMIRQVDFHGVIIESLSAQIWNIGYCCTYIFISFLGKIVPQDIYILK
jgi:hypothetical protein